jgi:hypothetical protein
MANTVRKNDAGQACMQLTFLGVDAKIMQLIMFDLPPSVPVDKRKKR